jgi:hypothetical protein
MVESGIKHHNPNPTPYLLVMRTIVSLISLGTIVIGAVNKNSHFGFFMWQNRYRIKAVLNVETDIIASITESMTERVVILVKMFVETFKADVIVFIGNIIFFSNVTQTNISTI